MIISKKMSRKTKKKTDRKLQLRKVHCERNF